jgi:CheY-like chemotaxis protein
MVPKGQSVEAARLRALGIAATMTKPIRRSSLQEAIKTALISPPKQENLSASEVPAPCRAGRSLAILLVEDNVVNRKLVSTRLQKEGHHIVSAENGREALSALEQRSFDVVLMDVQMPEMSGLEATAAIRLREQGTGHHIPIIAMTAHAMKGDRERCLDAGMDGYLTKPIQLEALRQVIHKLTAGCRHESMEGALDRAVVLESVGGDWNLLRQIVELFLANCPQMMVELRDAIVRSDAGALRLVAHTLKGAMSHFGALAAYEVTQLEWMGRTGDLAGATESLAILEDEIHRLEQDLVEFVTKGDPSQAGISP